jgi:hypothetical protein
LVEIVLGLGPFQWFDAALTGFASLVSEIGHDFSPGAAGGRQRRLP